MNKAKSVSRRNVRRQGVPWLRWLYALGFLDSTSAGWERDADGPARPVGKELRKAQ
jgi:hypothetical protein